MADLNNNGREDAHDVADFLKNTVEDIRDNARELNTTSYSTGTRKIMSDKTAKIIKRIIIIWLILQFSPAIFGIVLTVIALIIELVQKASVNSDNGISHIPKPEDEPISDEAAKEIIGTIEKTIVDTLESIKDFFTIEGNVVLWVLLALVVGILIIMILRAATTKKGPVDEQFILQDTIQSSSNQNFGSITEMAEVQNHECNDSNISSNITAESDSGTTSE